ncbi:18029_t:CDS:1 [Funneliformis geosporum]|nr:18029_t:CDS:1 [Funneliformis geosporum]
MDFETDTTLNILEGVGSVFLNYDGPRQATLDEGRYIAIDTDITKERSSSCNFSRRSVINVNVGNSSGLPGEGGFRELVERTTEAREMRARANEWSDFDKQMQQAWQLQPPKK